MTLGNDLRELCATLAESRRLVVLEGCDGVGKTAFADHLAAHHGFEVVHSARSPDGVDLAVRHRGIIETPGRRALDRSFVSELVYGPLHHGGSRLSWDQAVELSQLVAALDGVFIYLTADPRCILDRLQRRQNGEVWRLNQVQRLQDRYDVVFAELASHAPVVRQRTDRNH